MSESFKTTELRSLETVFVPDNTKLKPGVKICDGFVVGKVLSHGVQVCIGALLGLCARVGGVHMWFMVAFATTG